MKPELQLAARLADDYIEFLDTRKISGETDPAPLRARLAHALSEEGLPAEQVIRELHDDTVDGLLNTGSGRFFGWVIGGTLPVSVAADWLVSAWDQNSAAYACSPSTTVIEEVAGEWLKDLFGLPAHTSFGFVTGCQAAHTTCLAAARHRVLADCGWNVEEQGLNGSPPIRVLVGEHHETLLRALRFLGIGTDAVVRVAQHENGPVNVNALKTELERHPGMATIVALAAGDLNRGAFDDFDSICDIAHDHGAWVHVDGAFGLWAATSQRFRHLVKGMERADSWATDAHKWLNVPYDCGVAFVADAEAHAAAMSIHAAYKVEVEGVRDQIEWNPEWSRRARSVPVYAALRHLGRNGVARIIENCCDRARDLVARLSELPGVEVLSRPVINQGLVRFLDPRGLDHDRRTQEVIDRVNASGEAWFGPTEWRGMRVMRISVSSYRTSKGDVDRAVNAVEQALAG